MKTTRESALVASTVIVDQAQPKPKTKKKTKKLRAHVSKLKV